jgi:hypothetical protein
LFLLLVVGCDSGTQQKVDSDQAIKNLKTQAEDMGRAGIQEDHAKLVDLTHPALVEKLGGRDAYLKHLEKVAAEMKGEGFRATTAHFDEPTQPIKSTSQMYAVIPYVLEVRGPGGAKGKVPTYFIAASKDGGARWTFVDGSGMGGNPEMLKILFPDFPEQLKLPAARPPVWEKK